MDSPSLSVLIPAAGASTRLGQAKQLVNYQGKPLLQHIVDVVSAINPVEIIIVTGANAEMVRESVQHPLLCWIHNSQWAEGLGGSIAIGAQAVNSRSSGLMIMLCDQYRITATDLQELVETWRTNQDRIVAAETGGHCMPPLVFPPDMFNAVEHLAGQRGAHKLLEQHPTRVIAVPIDNAAFDLDEPEQLRNL